MATDKLFGIIRDVTDSVAEIDDDNARNLTDYNGRKFRVFSWGQEGMVVALFSNIASEQREGFRLALLERTSTSGLEVEGRLGIQEIVSDKEVEALQRRHVPVEEEHSVE